MHQILAYQQLLRKISRWPEGVSSYMICREFLIESFPSNIEFVSRFLGSGLSRMLGCIFN